MKSVIDPFGSSISLVGGTKPRCWIKHWAASSVFRLRRPAPGPRSHCRPSRSTLSCCSLCNLISGWCSYLLQDATHIWPKYEVTVKLRRRSVLRMPITTRQVMFKVKLLTRVEWLGEAWRTRQNCGRKTQFTVHQMPNRQLINYNKLIFLNLLI